MPQLQFQATSGPDLEQQRPADPLFIEELYHQFTVACSRLWRCHFYIMNILDLLVESHTMHDAITQLYNLEEELVDPVQVEPLAARGNFMCFTCQFYCLSSKIFLVRSDRS